jgi:hypothetical protein
MLSLGIVPARAAAAAVIADMKVPVSAAAIVADPLPALWARRAEIDAICNTLRPVPGYDLLYEVPPNRRAKLAAMPDEPSTPEICDRPKPPTSDECRSV